jgi:hypothetical protein
MLDPSRLPLDAATIGFRKRMRQPVDEAAFKFELQRQTDCIKVRREQKETPISEVHVMGGQLFGVGGNSKTNEYARQQRQINGYALRQFSASGPMVLPSRHSHGLLQTPANVGLTQYVPLGVGVVGDYVSSQTDVNSSHMFADFPQKEDLMRQSEMSHADRQANIKDWQNKRSREYQNRLMALEEQGQEVVVDGRRAHPDAARIVQQNAIREREAERIAALDYAARARPAQLIQSQGRIAQEVDLLAVRGGLALRPVDERQIRPRRESRIPRYNRPQEEVPRDELNVATLVRMQAMNELNRASPGRAVIPEHSAYATQTAEQKRDPFSALASEAFQIASRQGTPQSAGRQIIAATPGSAESGRTSRGTSSFSSNASTVPTPYDAKGNPRNIRKITGESLRQAYRDMFVRGSAEGSVGTEILPNNAAAGGDGWM